MFTDYDLGIRSHQIRPLRRHRVNQSILALKQKSHSITVVSLANTSQPMPTQRMKRMHHKNKMRRCNRSICILD